MRLYPMTTIDFQDMFLSDEACLAYLISLLRRHEGFQCPACKCKEAWEMNIINALRDF